MDPVEETLDLSNKKLKKLNKPTPHESQVTTLILDDNELLRLDSIDSFTKLQKTIEHLNTNTKLEYLDLSENSISYVSDLSYLKNLKELYLHKNKINHLGQCDRFLPSSLTTLTLANNNIADLNEISRLAHLVNLTKISIANNPCVNMTGNNIGFDYRPFVINWCLNVSVIDDYVVDPIESLRAEWLYSQGRGRNFRVGDQKELTSYLATVCPLTGERLETEEDRKLRLILSKAQHHQQQLRQQSSANVTPNPSPLSRKKLQANKHSPRLASRLSNKSRSPDRMTSSCYNTLSEVSNNSIMTQSLDPSVLRQSIGSRVSNDSNNCQSIPEKCLDNEPINSPLQALSKMVPVPESLMSPDYRPSLADGKKDPMMASMGISRIGSPKITHTARSGNNMSRSAPPGRTRNQLNQEHLRKCGSPSPSRQKIRDSGHVNKQETNKKSSILRHRSPSSEEESEICDAKLQTIQMKAVERKMQKEEEANSNSGGVGGEDKVERAAICIQRIWRGFYTRNKDKEVQEMFRELQSQRANQYIQKLATDMETTKAALESERKIQMLQTEAISALWKKISALQPNEEAGGSGLTRDFSMTNLAMNNSDVVKELSQTCTMLQTQIQQLQNSMQDIVKVMTVFSQTAGINHQLNNENGIATQTEIVAVHTPQGEAAKVFPFQKQPQSRPSSLPLPVHQKKKDANFQTSNNGVVNAELKQFADSLVESVIKRVAEAQEETEGQTEITVTDTDVHKQQNDEESQ
ncbi:unnamed protein product [Acanthoscelides obtectus]|uniref:Centrosomal protein of 97 kDa n=1 Tax=Acanthoscelides obtectus TaxID=200917 RepID=A0A9P0L7Q0_ACAOB|nr:unnamed protein product [Acanthoscelides obtectus]CAK1637926.1 Centrosomal protein of 97 kDa [Acanthoscelides obtectus]